MGEQNMTMSCFYYYNRHEISSNFYCTTIYWGAAILAVPLLKEGPLNK